MKPFYLRLLAALYVPIILAALAAACFSQEPTTCRIFAPKDDTGAGSLGTGTYVAQTETHGIVVTCWHVVDKVGEGLYPVVTFPEGFKSKAYIVEHSEEWDVAVLFIVRPDFLPIRWSPEVVKIQEELTVGGYGETGIYRESTGYCNSFAVMSNDHPMDYFTIRAVVRPGDSGGPIVNEHGEFVGMAQQRIYKEETNETYGCIGIHSFRIDTFIGKYVE